MPSFPQPSAGLDADVSTNGSRPLRVGLLGCGRIAGYFHAPILASDPNVALVAIADADAGARDRAGRHDTGAVRFADWRRAIDVAGLDAVVICLPPALHAPAAIAAFRKGLHVYVEKPMALDAAEADSMVEAWRSSGRVGMVGFNFRFHPLYENLRARRLAGEFGRIEAIRTLFTSARRQQPDWKRTAGQGGDALSDLATHHLDLAPFLVGQGIVENTVRVTETFGNAGSIATVDARLADGCRLQVLAGQTTGHGVHRVELLSENGHVTVDLADAAPRALETPPGRFARIHRLADRIADFDPRRLAHASGRDPSFRRALGAFVAACRGATPSYPDIEDGRRVVALIETARTASEIRDFEPERPVA